MMLDPDRYQCPDHRVDLTGQVWGALEDAGPPLAYRPPFPGRRAGPAPFRVIVTCPGAGGGGEHSPDV